MNPAELALLAATTFVAAGLQGSIGFGAGLVAAPVIALVEPSLLPALVVMLAAVITLLVAVRERSELDLKGAGWALAGRIPGSVLGAWLVASAPVRTMSWLVAVCVLAGVGAAFLGW
ncbi:TSUP family transporter, partial [Arthrobacter sp. GCM10027362]|uniref:TSUP family transporter n=1 Tax=Arthrobacter sp. GCM10027362 TaxID=3273379 RepID=UPI00362CC7D8